MLPSIVDQVVAYVAASQRRVMEEQVSLEEDREYRERRKQMGRNKDTLRRKVFDALGQEGRWWHSSEVEVPPFSHVQIRYALHSMFRDEIIQRRITETKTCLFRAPSAEERAAIAKEVSEEESHDSCTG